MKNSSLVTLNPLPGESKHVGYFHTPSINQELNSRGLDSRIKAEYQRLHHPKSSITDNNDGLSYDCGYAPRVQYSYLCDRCEAYFDLEKNQSKKDEDLCHDCGYAPREMYSNLCDRCEAYREQDDELTCYEYQNY